MLKSALYILLLPILVSIAPAAAFIYSMEREAEGFRKRNKKNFAEST